MTTDSWATRTQALTDRFDLPDVHHDYVGFEAVCRKCGRAAPVFLWPGIRDWSPPPAPVPSTVKLRFSKTLGQSYPANSCIHCDAMFGDFYLFDLLLDNLDYDEAGGLADASSTTRRQLAAVRIEDKGGSLTRIDV